MALTNKRQHSQCGTVAVVLDSKPRPAFHEPPRRLQTIKDLDRPPNSMTESKSLLQGKLLRQRSGELAATSPYAGAGVSALQRSKSFTKVRPKGKTGKTASPEKLRSGKFVQVKLRADSLASSKPQFALHFPNVRKKRSDVSLCSQSLLLSDSIPEEDTEQEKVEVSLSDSFSQSLANFPALELHGNSLMTAKIKAVREKMERGLVEIAPGSNWEEEMKVYSEAFGEVAAIGDELGAVLDTIKLKYEGWLRSFSTRYTSELHRSQSELSSLQTALLRETDERKALKRRLEKLSRECIELGKSCEMYQNRCFEYQEKLSDIANIQIGEFPPTENAWRLILTELETYKSWKDNACKQLNLYQRKERKLLSLLHALKNRGYPVEDVYNSDVKKQVSTPSEPSSASSEAEPICSGPALIRLRPKQVPALKIDAMESAVSSESHFSSHESTLHDSDNAFILDQSWSEKSRRTQESSTSNGVRKEEKAKGERMLDALGDVSESWKRVLDDQD